MNKVILMGRLVKDPEVIKNGNDTITKYTLAVDRRTKDGGTDFIQCVCFGKTADFAEKYLNKGTKIITSGKLRTGSYEKNGQKIYTTEVRVDEQEFVEKKQGDSGFTNTDNEEPPFT